VTRAAAWDETSLQTVGCGESWGFGGITIVIYRRSVQLLLAIPANR